MNKIEKHVEELFSSVPSNSEVLELKEELINNLTERYNDYVESGMSEDQAYGKAVANIGDIDSLIAEVTPNRDLTIDSEYKKRYARNKAIAIMLYIISPIVAIIGSAYDQYNSVENSLVSVGSSIVMILIIGFATCLLVYSKQMMKDRINSEIESDEHNASNAAKRKAISLTVVAFYIIISTLTDRWDITWVMFLFIPLIKILVLKQDLGE